jgi:flagellar motility protein MotE (MotC chaperone)
MNPFEMVVLIVLIVTIGRVFSGRFGNREQRRLAKMGVLPAQDNAENQRLQAEVARLNERIRVLERLATDPAKRLSDEIESLKND